MKIASPHSIRCLWYRLRVQHLRMTPWQRWVHRPQSLWLRKIVFQIHLWIGIAVGLYAATISISGSALVYGPQFARKFHRTVAVVSGGRQHMTADDVERSARRLYKEYDVLSVTEQQPDQLDVVVLESGNRRIVRLLDPYTGADLGDPRSRLDRIVRWLADLHDNLLSGLTGRTLNGWGACLVVILSGTGSIVWWPGIKNWRRSLTISPHARFARFNWDLHSAVGFWCAVLVLIWGISGILLCFPGILSSLLGHEFRYWITSLHFGRFNRVTRAIWTLLGLAPGVLAATGALMWWNRVLAKKLDRRRDQRTVVSGILIP